MSYFLWGCRGILTLITIATAVLRDPLSLAKIDYKIYDSNDFFSLSAWTMEGVVKCYKGNAAEEHVILEYETWADTNNFCYSLSFAHLSLSIPSSKLKYLLPTL